MAYDVHPIICDMWSFSLATLAWILKVLVACVPPRHTCLPPIPSVFEMVELMSFLYFFKYMRERKQLSKKCSKCVAFSVTTCVVFGLSVILLRLSFICFHIAEFDISKLRICSELGGKVLDFI